MRQVLPVRQRDVRRVAQRVALITYATVPRVLRRQPAAAVILKTHRVGLHPVLLLPRLRGRERHCRYLVQPVVAERPLAVFILRP
ncbi:Uncharacterised protein [Salmonella enterica subsp. enterica serovar Typhi]|nr:Uncharacterised protein [Salmonella enterica subsp. enterica serovar Typhi]CHY12027.1 Uncharacterised protein [Salmonella enterica subsp. enterica serovar Typhi]CQF53679.1 Uncharacterised protein [Salmonella enterica subsp. enterica serovar Typhimurium str. DT104]CQT99392.1 Uncharacterised protein [Salmonella enterica subsp. enterica serovar Typhi]CRC95380.1 Uncharacterised protein [Salmonella enterica subsp. enterica serovar Typhi]